MVNHRISAYHFWRKGSFDLSELALFCHGSMWKSICYDTLLLLINSKNQALAGCPGTRVDTPTKNLLFQVWAYYGVELYTELEEYKKLLLSLIFVLFWPCDMRDLSSPTRDRTWAPCSGSAESWPLDRRGSPRKLFAYPTLPPWALLPALELTHTHPPTSRSKFSLPRGEEGIF